MNVLVMLAEADHFERWATVDEAVTSRPGQPDAAGPFAETVEQLGGFYLIDVPTSPCSNSWSCRVTDSRPPAPSSRRARGSPTSRVRRTTRRWWCAATLRSNATWSGGARTCESDQPPATAGMTETWVPSGVGVSRFSRKRTSSLPT
ncbi:YCII-related domain-containing protein [Nocardioides psychrotolerans]|uniref:YCII-related domain-containing protein n=1 Tax=Nocardioides psychrotolerans TaxID=1005945 RepID=A0A1I3BUT1_9ACTN|nr:YCII-related domain-containing protein [Nocardioides psychrotolerans]